MSISDDGWTWRRAGARDAGRARRTARPGRHRARRQQHAGRRTSSASATSTSSTTRRRARSRSRPSACWSARRSIPTRLTTSGRTAARSSGPTASRTATRSIPACSAIRRTARCGSPTAPTSATSVSSSWIRRPASGCIPTRKPVNIAINSEASIMIFRDGWYYLLVTHGSCCAGANSSYNIRMGRAQKVTGPVPRQHGHRHAAGRRQAVRSARAAATSAPAISACSISATACRSSRCHYEADLDRGGISVLDIRPLLWRDGWPVAGENFTAGTYADRVGAHGHGARAGRAGRAGRRASRPRRPRRPRRRSRRRGGAGRAGRRRHPRLRRADSAAGGRAGVGELAGRAGRRAHGALHGAGAAEVGDHAGRRMPAAIPGSPFFKITIAGTDRALAATADARAGRPAGIHRRAGATVAHRPARRRHLSR